MEKPAPLKQQRRRRRPVLNIAFPETLTVPQVKKSWYEKRPADKRKQSEDKEHIAG